MPLEDRTQHHRSSHCFLVSLDTLPVELIHNENIILSTVIDRPERLYLYQGVWSQTHDRHRQKQGKDRHRIRHR